MLGKKEFYKAIELTQLVSLDLIIMDDSDRILVGRSTNNPAKGYYFVPGSRIYKNETLNDAVRRVSLYELGFEIKKSNTSFYGIYDHIYDNNFLDNEFGTHYVCNAISYKVCDQEKKTIEKKMMGQHDDVKWMTKEELLANDNVHKYTKNYFVIDADNKFN